MAQTIKISDREANILRMEAPLFSRSIAGQAEHWLRIGRAIERSPNFNYQRIQEALSAEISPDELSAEEGEVYLDEFMETLSQVTPEQEAFFADRRKKGLGVGMDENDNIVYQSPEQQ